MRGLHDKGILVKMAEKIVPRSIDSYHFYVIIKVKNDSDGRITRFRPRLVALVNTISL